MEFYWITMLLLVLQGVDGKHLVQKNSKLESSPRHSFEEKQNTNSCKIENQQTAHESRCDLYYRCVYGVKVQKECPAGKLFNTHISNCDNSYNVDCNNRIHNNLNKLVVHSFDFYDPQETTTLDLSDEETSPSVENGECPEKKDPYEPSPLLPHEESCNHFYKCINGKKVLMKCPKPFQFNYKVLACDWPQNARCYNRKIDSTTVH
ncbi:unnamed protein product [Diabrotica balteata]|uniref:Chitin-binding type-2 domain-containing protein n=1 Tax=Diabrotica balteata TaxID=107213 RepID=A0A9N9XBA6_DIABA|nr:unnamed protein product [Diabrotica balteata]